MILTLFSPLFHRPKSFWCSPCTICQIGRHTADYSQYNLNCCSETGLDPMAPEVVWADFKEIFIYFNKITRNRYLFPSLPPFIVSKSNQIEFVEVHQIKPSVGPYCTSPEVHWFEDFQISNTRGRPKITGTPDFSWLLERKHYRSNYDLRAYAHNFPDSP